MSTHNANKRSTFGSINPFRRRDTTDHQVIATPIKRAYAPRYADRAMMSSIAIKSRNDVVTEVEAIKRQVVLDETGLSDFDREAFLRRARVSVHPNLALAGRHYDSAIIPSTVEVVEEEDEGADSATAPLRRVRSCSRDLVDLQDPESDTSPERDDGVDSPPHLGRESRKQSAALRDASAWAAQRADIRQGAGMPPSQRPSWTTRPSIGKLFRGNDAVSMTDSIDSYDSKRWTTLQHIDVGVR